MSGAGWSAIPAHAARNRELPIAAKGLFVTLASYADQTGTAWPSQARLAADTGQSEATVKRQLDALRKAGLVTWEVRRTRVGRQRFYTVWRPGDAVVGSGQSEGGVGSNERVGVGSSQGGEQEPGNQNHENHHTPGKPDVEPEALFDAPESPDAQVIHLPAPAASAGPPKTAQTLVARWCDGYRDRNAGEDAPKPFMRRVAGQARTLAKDCGDDHDSWVAAYNAAYTAGGAGHADMTRYLVKTTRPAARTNALLDLRGAGAEAMHRMGIPGYGGNPFQIGAAQ